MCSVLKTLPTVRLPTRSDFSNPKFKRFSKITLIVLTIIFTALFLANVNNYRVKFANWLEKHNAGLQSCAIGGLAFPIAFSIIFVIQEAADYRKNSAATRKKIETNTRLSLEDFEEANKELSTSRSSKNQEIITAARAIAADRVAARKSTEPDLDSEMLSEPDDDLP